MPAPHPRVAAARFLVLGKLLRLSWKECIGLCGAAWPFGLLVDEVWVAASRLKFIPVLLEQWSHPHQVLSF